MPPANAGLVTRSPGLVYFATSSGATPRVTPGVWSSWSVCARRGVIAYVASRVNVLDGGRGLTAEVARYPRADDVLATSVQA